MKSLMIQSAAAALLAASVVPAFAQERAAPNQSPFFRGQPECTQLEYNAGLRGEECGKLSLNEIVKLKADRDNVN